VRSGIEATIGSQLEALAQADFASAREFASESFQATVNERQFRAIIEGEFAVLLTDPEVGFDVCVSLHRGLGQPAPGRRRRAGNGTSSASRSWLRDQGIRLH